ncbi:PD-(D/E)XK nuclease family protein, partial [candidate division NPL-UPA2 bacterium]|nr:PD-(D/E)XK nuclease family protein [candidate division NPL-UPA2 bacterium]
GERFQEILTFLLRHSPAAHYPFSGEFFQSFLLLLDKLKNSLLKDEELKEPKDLFDLFRHVAGEERISFQGIPLKGLQIMGLLETRGLNFDCVFLLDANEEVLPSVESFDSLLPLPVRAALGLPLPYQKEEIYGYHFHHLISSTRRAHIFYRQTEKDFRSRFVEKLVWEREKRAGQRGVLPAEPVELNVSLRPSPGFEVPKSPELLNVLREMSFSPSGLNSYLLCPLQFYFARVLGLEKREGAADEQDSARVGIVLHKILERLYRPLAGKGVMGEKGYAYLEKSLPPVLDNVFAETFGEPRGESYLLKEMVLNRLKKYILGEKQRFINNMSIISVEEPLSCSLKLKDGREVRLTGRADRIDRYEYEGEYMIVDYKSGRDLIRHSFRAFEEVLPSREKMREKIKSLQLPLYAFLYGRARSLPPEKMNSRVISLRTVREEILFDGKINRKKVLEDVFLPTLRNLIQEILNQEIPFRRDDGNEEACQYCSFLTFCHKTSDEGLVPVALPDG